MKKPVVLMVLDGWGIGEAEHNAILTAQTPCMNALWQKYPHGKLTCFGAEVGLPDNQQGNSEVGHLTLGAGRIIDQDLTKINKAIKDGTFAQNEAFRTVIDNCLRYNKKLHLLGLVSPGGVHSHMDHMLALVKMASASGMTQVYLHGFLDGRDVGPQTAAGFIQTVETELKTIGCGQFATICGRYYAMDRDQRWERVEKAYQAMVFGVGEKAGCALEGIVQSTETDEFILPTVITDQNEQPIATIDDGDGVIFCNFRADRAREISRCFVQRETVPISTKPMTVDFCAMTQYYEGIDARIAYPPLIIENTLGQVLSHRHLQQLRIAETEKYAHVTFFFNGGIEEPNALEDRILVPSPKVATYDLQPKMSAPEVTQRLLDAIDSERYDFILVNYANTDMVGHTGVMAAAVQAVEAVDEAVEQIVSRVLTKNGALLITSDHGNAEKMFDSKSNTPHTAHTNNYVPFIIVDDSVSCVHDGALQDVAPTILAMLTIDKPAEMTGDSLIDQ